MARSFPSFTVTKKAEKSIKSGQPLVYGEEVLSHSGEYQNGGIGDVYSEKGKYLGSGFINDNSKILLRIISKNANDKFDDDFFRRRVRYALQYRLDVLVGEISACRLIYGDSDGLPGLVVDRFGCVLVSQCRCLGTEMRKNIILTELVRLLREKGEKITAVYERNDVPSREKEGLTQYKDFFVVDGLENSAQNPVQIEENGIKYYVDFINGQKTGFFLDQKYNRLAIKSIARGKRVLDCFTHTGSFALNAADGGAKSVTAVDISATALAQARENAVINGLEDKINFVEADVFSYLTEKSKGSRGEFDFIILDPPAFTKSTSTIANAASGYREINTLAMKILPRGGYLATCSCSHFMSDALFRQVIAEAASFAGVNLLQIEGKKQSKDHPILWGVPETEYLKFYIFRVI